LNKVRSFWRLLDGALGAAFASRTGPPAFLDICGILLVLPLSRAIRGMKSPGPNLDFAAHRSNPVLDGRPSSQRITVGTQKKLRLSINWLVTFIA
jgi:hypothetical protein